MEYLLYFCIDIANGNPVCLFFYFKEKAKKYINELENRMQIKLQPSSNTRLVTEGPAAESITKPDEWWQEQSIGKDDWSVSNNIFKYGIQ